MCCVQVMDCERASGGAHPVSPNMVKRECLGRGRKGQRGRERERERAKDVRTQPSTAYMTVIFCNMAH